MEVHEGVGEMELGIMVFTIVVFAEKVVDDKPTHRTEHRKTWWMTLDCCSK